MLNWEGLYLCACRRLEWTGRPPLRAALFPGPSSTLRAQQHLGVNHGELSEYTHTPRLSHGRGPSGGSARKLGDGLHWERRGLLYRVRTSCLYTFIRWTFTVTTKVFGLCRLEKYMNVCINNAKYKTKQQFSFIFHTYENKFIFLYFIIK